MFPVNWDILQEILYCLILFGFFPFRYFFHCLEDLTKLCFVLKDTHTITVDVQSDNLVIREFYKKCLSSYKIVIESHFDCNFRLLLSFSNLKLGVIQKKLDYVNECIKMDINVS